MPQPRFNIAPLALAVLLAVGLPAAVRAQAGAATVDVAILAQPLGQALNEFARQANLQLMFPPELVAARTAPAVSGRLTPRQALEKLLAGSGLTAAVEGNRVIVRRPDVSGDALLPAVKVSAQGERSATTEGSGAYTTGLSTTATRLNLSLRETPQSVSVITRQRMEDQGLTQLVDVIAQTPGLVLAQGGNAGSDSSPIYSRGFGIDTYMVDGVRHIDSNYTDLAQSNDTAILDRIEIVRGATGLMNGIGTPGGAINLVRKRPTAKFQAAAKVELGSWDHRRVEADLSTPLNEAGSLRGRLVAALQDNQSYIDRLEEKKQVLYGVIEADLAAATVLHAGISAQRHDASGHARGGLPAYYSDGTRTHWSRSASAAAQWAYSERRYTSIFAGLEHRFDNDWLLKATLDRSYSSYDELLGYASGGNPNPATGAGVNLWAGRWSAEPRQDSLDLYATGKFTLLGREHDLTLGALLSRTYFHDLSYTNWYHTDWSPAVANINTWDGGTPAAPANPPIGTYSSDERVNSVYASARFRPTDAFSVLAGARLTDWSRYQTSTRFSTGLTTITDRGESGEVTPYAALMYDLDRHWSAYASYTNIFKAQNNKTAGGDYIEPLLGNSYEIGIKGAFDGDRLNLSAAIYKVDQDNLAVSLPNVFAPDGSQAYESVSGTRTRGVEFEASGELRPGWQVMAGLTRNTTRDRSGARLLTNLPQSTAKLYTSYRIGGAGTGGHDLTLGGGLRWQSEIYSDNQGPAKVRQVQPAHAVADLMLRQALTRLTAVTLNLYNVFDKEYYNTTGNSYYGAPRSLRLALETRF